MRAFILLIMTFTLPVFAASQVGEITGYIPYSSGSKTIMIFKLKNNVVNGCNTTGRFAIASTSPRFKATEAAVLAAFHSKTPVRVAYLNSCNAWGNSADVNYICVGDINC